MMSVYLRLFISAVFSICLAFNAYGDEPVSSGTGFAVNEDGWVMTNAHVVEGCSRIEVGNFGVASDIRKDTTNDLALVKVNANPKVKPLLLRRDIIRLGEDIIALGYPLNGVLSDSIKMTTGNISSLSGIQNDTRFLQISTPVQPGNSGGPVVDRSGNVIGVTTAVLSKQLADEKGFTAQNLNFAVRATVADLFMQAQGISASYTPAEDAGKPQPSTADIAEATSPSVYKIVCYAPKQEIATTPVQSAEPVFNAPPQSTRLITQNNYDAIGFDYSMIRNVSYGECALTCENDGRCVAVTWHKRLLSCMLKGEVVALIKNKDAVAAYKSFKANSVYLSDFTAYSGFDFPGGDYARIKQADYVDCFMSCIRDNLCRAFSYIPKKKECWLKDRLGKPRVMKGVELGMK